MSLNSIRRGITAVLLTWNEERNVRKCLESVGGLYDDLYVVDSGSTDRTVEICREFTDKIHYHRFIDSRSQWEWALESLPIENEWILPIDADHVFSPELNQQLRDMVAKLEDERVAGVYSRHQYYFHGQRMRGFKQYSFRLLRGGRVTVDRSELVDFRFIVNGSTVTVPAAL